MTTILFKRGDSLSIDAQFTIDGVAAALPPIINSQVRSRTQSLVDTLTVTVTDAANGKYNLSASAAQTSNWPTTTLNFDAQYTESDGTVHSSQTGQLVVEPDVTKLP